MFDEEVERLVAKQPAPAATISGSNGLDLLAIVTAQHLRFETNSGHRPLTATVADVLAAALLQHDLDTYKDLLGAYVSTHRGDIAQLNPDYGVHSAKSTSRDYVPWSQPESVALLEHRKPPHCMLTAWRDAGRPRRLGCDRSQLTRPQNTSSEPPERGANRSTPTYQQPSSAA